MLILLLWDLSTVCVVDIYIWSLEVENLGSSSMFVRFESTHQLLGSINQDHQIFHRSLPTDIFDSLTLNPKNSRLVSFAHKFRRNVEEVIMNKMLWRRSQECIKYLWWSFFTKIVDRFANYFRIKSSIIDTDRT